MTMTDIERNKLRGFAEADAAFYFKMNDLRHRVETQLADCRQRLLDFLESMGTDREDVGDYRVERTKYTAVRFNVKRFHEEHESMYNEYAEITSAQRISVKQLTLNDIEGFAPEE